MTLVTRWNRNGTGKSPVPFRFVTVGAYTGFMSTYTIPASRVAKAKDLVSKANKRAEKAGIGGRYELSIGDARVVQDRGRNVTVHDVTLTGSPLKYDDWTFAARVDVHPGGETIVSAAPGMIVEDQDEIDGHNCDHCSTNRRRLTSFIVRNDVTGDTKQVGSACMKSFLGFAPAIWFLEFADKLVSFSDGPYDVTDFVIRPKAVIAYALEASNDGLAFKRAAEDGSTAGVVRGMIHDGVSVDHREADADEVIETINDLVIRGDYGFKLTTLVNAEWVDHTAIGILASAVKVWRDEKSKELAEAEINESYLPGAPKERIRDIPVTITGTREFPGDYGTKTLVKMRDDENRIVVWWASKSVGELRIKDAMTIKAATVKAHGSYDGHFQTELTRVQFA